MKKIAQITDLHLDDFLAHHYQKDARQHFAKALVSARDRGISTAILTGDLGSPKSHAWLFEALHTHGFEFHLLLGNHDTLTDFQGYDFLRSRLQPDGLYYSQRLNGLECICLDSSAGAVGSEQLDWLEKQLAASDDPLLLFVHHPILDCGNTVADRNYPLQERDTVRDVLVASERSISIFCGHYHFRAAIEKTEGRVRQFLTPAIFGQFKPKGPEIEPESDGYIAYREIWLENQTVQTEVVEVQ